MRERLNPQELSPGSRFEVVSEKRTGGWVTSSEGVDGLRLSVHCTEGRNACQRGEKKESAGEDDERIISWS